MTEQTEQEQTSPWQFAAEYQSKYKELPPSQRRECLKRLQGRRRNPLSEEQCREVCPDVEACLEAVHRAFLNKKQRSKTASATKRMIDRAQPEPAEVEPAAEVEAVSDAVAAISLEPAIIVAEPEPTPAPAPTPEPPAVKRSAPIPIPGAVAKPVPVARAPAATPMPALALPALAQPPKPAAQKGGLGAMLKR